MLWTAAAILPLLAIFLWATWRKRQALIRSFVQNKQLADLTLGTSTSFQKLRRALLFLAVAALLFAVARPQWGFAWEEATQRGRDITVAIDTSRSMLAEDLQPNRLTRAKLAALDLLKLGKFDRFGLVAFSGTAFLQCPLTFDDEAFRQSVQILEPGIIPQGGTALSEAIESARRAFSEDADDNHRVLVLFTDGEDHEEGVLNTVELAAADGMKIFTVGVGTSAGELLRIKDESGKLVFLKDSAGNVVKSRLNEQLLQQIAAQSGGFYLPLQGANAMELLYNKGLAPLPTSERSTKLMKRLKEQFYWPLTLAIFLLLLEIFIPQQKRAARIKPQNAQEPAKNPALALVLVFLFAPQCLAGASKAQKHYQAGEYKSALSEYQEMLAKNPNDSRLHYNAGAAAYHANKFDQSIKEFQMSAGSADIDLQQQSFYNLGNAEFRLGESNSNTQERMGLWEQAIQHYDAALKLKADDMDAAFNRDLVRKKLEELKQEQEQQQNDKKEENDDKEKNESKDEQQKQENQQEQKDEKSGQDQKSNEQKDEPNKSPQEEQKQQSENQEQEKKEGTPNDSQPQQEGDKQTDDQQKPDAEGQAEAAQLGKMTPAQAKQLLDAQKDEEKALIFVPQEGKSGAQNRTFKDW
ncbi:MAG: vWA domain-containing protein [Limisphaerales bacterium]